MTYKDLEDLGFEKREVTAEESGDNAYYYYIHSIGDFCLISSDSDQTVFWVEIFNTFPPIRYYCNKDVKQLIKIIKKGVNTEFNNCKCKS